MFCVGFFVGPVCFAEFEPLQWLKLPTFLGTSQRGVPRPSCMPCGRGEARLPEKMFITHQYPQDKKVLIANEYLGGDVTNRKSSNGAIREHAARYKLGFS